MKRPTEIDFSSTVDWEHPKTRAEGENFVHLLRATRAALPSPTHQLNTALPMDQYCLKNINLSEAAQELDLLNLMGYDFAGRRTENSDHQAQLFTPYGDGSPSAKKILFQWGRICPITGFPSQQVGLRNPCVCSVLPRRNGARTAIPWGRRGRLRDPCARVG